MATSEAVKRAMERIKAEAEAKRAAATQETEKPKSSNMDIAKDAALLEEYFKQALDEVEGTSVEEPMTDDSVKEPLTEDFVEEPMTEESVEEADEEYIEDDYFTEDDSSFEEEQSTTEIELEETRRQLAELKQIILQQQQELLSTQQFMQQSQQRYAQEQQNVFNSTQGFEHLTFDECTSEFCGQPFKYERYDQPVQFGRRFERGLSDEDTAKNYTDLCEEICSDIENKFGGWDRVTDLAVVSNLLIINSVSYEPILPQGYADSLPFDLRNNVNGGQFAWLFNFGLLRKMTRLTNLKFDSADFVYCKVRKDLHLVNGFSCKSFFKVCKNLRNLQIGQTVVTSANPTAEEDLFKKASRAEELYQKCCDNTWTFTKNRWSSVRDVFLDTDRSGLSKIWGVTWRGAVAAGGTAATLGVKGAGLLGKIGRGIGNIASAIKDNM